MQKVVKINCEEFELCKSLNFYDVVNNFKGDGIDLYDCYHKTSIRKKNVYDFWHNWFKSIAPPDACEYSFKFGIGSYNVNVFTLNALIKYCDKWYYIHITPTHNLAYPLTF